MKKIGDDTIDDAFEAVSAAIGDTIWEKFGEFIDKLWRKDMDFHYELLEETRKEIKSIRFFREDVEINAEEYEVIHDYDEAYENAFDREYEELEGQTWVDILEENMAEVQGLIYEHDNYAELSEILRHIEIPELDDIEFPIDDISVSEEMYNEIQFLKSVQYDIV